MIYLQVTWIAQPGKASVIAEAVRDAVPHFEKAGIRFVGAWHTTIGNADEITLVHAYEDLGHIDRSSHLMAQDQEYQTIFRKAQSAALSLTRKVMAPIAASPMK